MIYIIHFNNPLSHAMHYCGFVEGDEASVTARLEEHRQNWGAKILSAANAKGIRYEVVRIMPGDRKRERQIKNTHNISSYCPICRAKKRTKNELHI